MLFTTIDEYIEFLKNKVEHYENDYLKVLYIYLNLGTYFSFDTNYYFGNSKEKKSMYRKVSYTKDYFNKCFSSRMIICKSLSYICEYIYNYFGYYTISKVEDDSDHVYNVIKIQNKRYLIDLQLDLINIHSHSSLSYFGMDNNFFYDIIQMEELNNYLLNLEYFSSPNLLTNNILISEKNYLYKISTLSGKILYINNLINKLISPIGYLETVYNHKNFFYKLLTRKDFNKLSFASFYNVSSKCFVHFISYFEKNNTASIYMFNKNKNMYEIISENELLKDIKNNNLIIKKGQLHLYGKILTTTNILKVISKINIHK